ncbi:O-antigen ligase [Pseudomonas sp. URMO17WK12:I4]|uniref:O-antigen ligase family protein n=1 Tax=Pseudomonas sp. URMO17WK12:I4 TaxID=1283292 RepID=UPI000684763E|nr:O-antigen ligase family protein [Pseudomonas sp. URMO17WK12:I4]
MRTIYPRFDLLATWALLGLFTLLCAPWVMPSNKLYHQFLIILLWLPALLALKHAEFRKQLLRPELVFFTLLGVWTLIVAFIQSGADVLSDLKLPFYVLLSLLGVVLAAQQRKYSIETQLCVAALVAGPFALLSVVKIYYLEDNDLSYRVMAVGLWDKIIMAAHAVGALLVLGVLLSVRHRSGWSKFLVLLAIGAMGLFVLMSQTRGVWIALVAAFTVIVIARPTRLGIFTLCLGGLGVATVALFFPEFLAQRGLSYRPELFQKGLAIFTENWTLGIGFGEYGITVDALERTFKHPHNLYLDTGIRWGAVGLALFFMLWACVGWRAWHNRRRDLGLALLGLWTFSSVSLLTDGIGLWFKPNADWLVTWLPVAIGLVLAVKEGAPEAIAIENAKAGLDDVR